MSYQTQLSRAKTIKITTDVVTPPDYNGKKNFVIPDQIVEFCIEEYALLNDNMRVLDPMSGLGTIPRIINAKGGHCIGIEIDDIRFKASLKLTQNNNIFHGDFLKITPLPHDYRCIFTSIPFDWFKNIADAPSSIYADKFKQLLSNDGFILLDSVPIVSDLNHDHPIASRQCDYLENNGFSLIEMIKFHDASNEKNINESVIMMFKPL